MITTPHLSVRLEQLRVIRILHAAQRPLSPTEIAHQFNAMASRGQKPLRPIDVEATLEALLLRPRVRPFIKLNTRSATQGERLDRRRINLIALSGAVVLSACVSSAKVAHAPDTIRPYFSGVGVVAKADPGKSFHPFQAAPPQRCVGNGCLAEVDAAAIAHKTVDEPQRLLASYFDTDSARVIPPRSESALLPSASMPPANPSASPILALGARSPQPQSPTTLLLSAASPTPPYVLALPTVPRAVTVSDAPVHARVAQAAKSKMAPGIDLVMPPRPIEALDSHTSLVSFANSSDRLEPGAREHLLELAASARVADRIELRGRVGNRLLTTEMKRLAVARGIAVRRVLVELGVARSKIRIMAPRDNDLVQPEAPQAPSNRSVTIILRSSQPSPLLTGFTLSER